MNIFEALEKIDWQKKLYFQYKFPDLRYYQDRPLKSEEDLLRATNRKTTNPFLKWEKSSEYKNLVQLYLDTKIANDMEKVYEVVSSKAVEGDEKAVKLFLALQKDIQQNAKLAAKTFAEVDEELEKENEDNLDLDLS